MRRKDRAFVPSVETVYKKSPHNVDTLFQHVLRFIVLLTAVIGMNVAANGMLGLKADYGVMILTALYAFSAFYFIFRSVKGIIAGALILVLGMLGILFITDLSLKEFFVGGFVGLFNSVLKLISSFGYVTVAELKYDGISTAGIFVIVSALTSIIVALSCRRKTHVLPFAFIAVTLCSLYVIFAEKMPIKYPAFGGKVQIKDLAILIAAIAAMAVMSSSDRRSGTKDRSGPVGFVAFILAAAILISPIAAVKTPMKQDGFFTEFYTKLLELYNMVREGSTVGRFSASRDVTASKRKHTGTEIMTVYSGSNRPIYLRTWTGGSFSNNVWLAMPASSNLPDPYTVADNFIYAAQNIGYDMETLGIKINEVTVDLKIRHNTLPVPSISSRLPSASFPSTGKGFNENKYDGIVSLSSPYKGKYTLNSLTYVSGDEDFTSFLNGYLQYMNVYLQTQKMPENASSVALNLKTRFGTYSLMGFYGTMQKMDSFIKHNSYFYYDYDPSIEAAIDEIFSTYDIEQYYTRPENTPFNGNGVILYGSDYYVLEDHGRAHVTDIIKIVADYLSDKCEYDTDPKKTDAESVTEELLFGSKEGYCVQFATVGALIMRRLGFPTRYAEGYIVRNFRLNNADRENGIYRCTVRDNDSHAWVEVWVDGFGWMQAEMTPGYSGGNIFTPPPETENTETSEPITTPESSSDTTEITETSGRETSPENPGTTPVGTGGTEPDTTDIPPYGGEDGKDISPSLFIITAVIILAAAALIASAFVKADKNKKRLQKLIERGTRRDTLNSVERELLGGLLTSCLARALKAYGIMPKDGELPEAYGRRLEESLVLKELDVPLSVCIDALSKQIYKGSMDETEITSAALTLQALSKNALRKLGLLKFLWYRLKGVI